MNAVEAAVRSVRPRVTNAQGQSQVAKIRERHHGIARLIVAGIPDEVVSKTFGISARRLDILREQTPAFIELLSYYEARRDKLVTAVETYIDVLERNMIAAEQEIADRLAETPEELTIGELHKVARDAADRLGYSKRTTQLNINADFASILEQARRRSDKAREGLASGPTLEAIAMPEREVPRLSSAPAFPQPEITPRAKDLHSQIVELKALNGDPPPTRAVLRRI